ncbi:MAG: N-acetylmuramoyl-L-alanine amidase family protein [Sarcina sp.]
MKKFKVMIDCGHYGKYNQSPLFKDYYESVFAWKLGQYLKSELEKYGAIVDLTRNNINTDMELYNRGTKSKGYDLFLSLHTNASSSPNTDYVVVFYGFDQPNTFNLAMELSKAIADIMGTVQKPQVLINKQEKKYEEYYGVLRGARAVGTKYRYIIEHSFHTNKKMAMFLYQEKNIRSLAIREAYIIAKHFKLSLQEDKPNIPIGANKFARIIVEDLNVRTQADWNCKPTHVVHYGDAFTIADTVEAKNGTTKMHKLKSGLYITASPRYVEVFYKN